MDFAISPRISPAAFTSAMRDHWTDTLGNVSSPALEALWSVMAATFNDAADASQRFEPDKTWRVLEPPTGSGKTQGVCVYASLVMQHNVLAAHPRGILIVTRTIDQAHEIVGTITRHVADKAPGRTVVTNHSQNDTTPSQMRGADVLVICHAAYTLGLERGRWTDFVEWDYGSRALTIIDEALSGIIDERHVKAIDVAQVLSFLSGEDRRAFPDQVAALESVQRLLEQIAAKSLNEATGKPSMSVAWTNQGLDAVPSMDALRQHMTGMKFDWLTVRRHDLSERRNIAGRMDNVLADCEALLSSWAYYCRRQGDHTFNNADLIIPPQLPGPVVLDATARQNFLWTLLEHRANRVGIPTGTRSYANVTLNVARTTHGLGKSAMNEHGDVRLTRLCAALEAALTPDRKVLIVCHKLLSARAKTYAPKFAAYDVAHYGAIDGRNTWADHDAAVIFGMHNMPPTWSRNAFMALQGLQSTEWLNEPARWKEYTDVRREMERRQLTVSIVQAANRVRCRRVVDAGGNCLPTDIFIVLPADAVGDDVLANLRDEMPGVRVVDWAFEIDGPRERVRRSNYHDALLSLMAAEQPGETSLANIKDALRLSPRALQRLREQLNSATHPLTVALAGIGVAYVVSGRTRRARAALIKRATTN